MQDKTAVSATPIIRILKTGSCPTLSGSGSLQYHVGHDANDGICFRITSNSGGGWYSYPRASTSDFIREDYLENATRTLTQNSEGESSVFGPRGTFSANYDFNAYNSISSSFSLRAFGRTQDNNTNSLFNDPIRDPYHPNPAGHALIAEEASRVIRSLARPDRTSSHGPPRPAD